MVLVRKTELACRDGWDQDLWEPRKEPERAENPGITRGLPGSDNSSGTGDINSESPTDADQPSNPARVPARVSSDFRTLDDDELESRDVSQSVLVPARVAVHNRRREASQPTHDPFFSSARFQYDELTQETVSTSDMVGAVPRARSVEQTGHSLVERVETEKEAQSTNDAEATRVRINLRNPEIPLPDVRELIQRSPIGPAGQDPVDGDVPRFGMMPEPMYRPEDSEPVMQSGQTEPFDLIDESTDVEPGNGVEVVMEPDPDESAENPKIVGEPKISPNGNGIRIPLAVQLEQRCRTCRDFRPSERSDQGWCNNPFAFDQRTLVPSHSLACRGTCGSWWTPADDWWMERADISHHASPTPNVENLIRSIHVDADSRVDVRRKKGVI